MAALAIVLQALISLFTLSLFARFILDYVRMFRQSWTPTGPLLYLAEFTYIITDPPIKLIRKIIPPIKIGPVALDLSFFVLLLLVQFLGRLLISVL
jgi:YggT family protein